MVGFRTAEQEFFEQGRRDLKRSQEAARRARAAASIAQPSDPRTTARANILSREFNAPPSVIESDIGGYETASRMSKAKDAARYGNFSLWLGDERNAALARDDIDNLGEVGRASATRRVVSTLFGNQDQQRFVPTNDELLDYRGFDRGAFIDEGYEAGLKVVPRHVRATIRAQSRSANDYKERVAALGNAALAPSAAEYAAFQDALEVQERQKRGVFGQTMGSLRAGTATAGGGIHGALGGLSAVLGLDGLEQKFLAIQAATEDYAAQQRGRSSSFVADSLYGGVESIPYSLSALVLAATSGGASGLTFFGGTSFGNSYAEAREDGQGVGRSFAYGAIQGGIEVGTERMPLGTLMRHIENGTGLGKTVKRFLVQEVATEQVATVMQDFTSYAMLNGDKTFGDYLAERPEAAARTFFGTVSGAGPQVAVAAGLRRALRQEMVLQESGEQLDALGNVMDAAEQSEVRKADPLSFRNLMELLGDGSSENIYVPADVIASYKQDYSDDQFWGDYASQIDEALETGSDVVIPVADAAARLSGTDSWAAIERDVRATPGGMSLNEIDAANAELEAIQAQATDDQEIADRVAREQAEPSEQLRANIRERLQNAGMTPDVAATNANIVAALYETRAARLGQDITGTEFGGVQVQQVLPEGIANFREGDALDRVINAMRKGGDPEIQQGATLLEFIASRGGINDVGGDLKAMGLDKWHRGKPGRKRLIRDFDPRQSGLGGISGEGDFGADTTLTAAIEAGYFPELLGETNVDGRALLEAISDELAGEPRFAEDPQIDQVRAAAQELERIVAQAGVDPATASREEIQSVIDGMQTEGGDLFQEAAPVDSDAFKAWAGTDQVIDAHDINDTDFSGAGPFVMRAYHGTTHEFEEFDATVNGTKEGQFGAVNYFTSSEADADSNYSGMGPDLTNRMEMEQERAENQLEYDLQGITDEDALIESAEDWVAENYPDFDAGSLDNPPPEALAEAENGNPLAVAQHYARAVTSRMDGGQNQVLEVFVRTEKPFVVGDGRSPFVEFRDWEAIETEAIERVADSAGVDVKDVRDNRDEYDDQIDEARWDIEADTPDELFEAIGRVAPRYNIDAAALYSSVAEMSLDGVSHSDLEKALRDSEALAYAENYDDGGLIGYHALGEIIQELGFDSIILRNAENRFGNMNIEPGTAHIHVFDENNSNIKSVNNRGTFDPNDARILFQRGEYQRILENQRQVEGLRAAIRDPKTKEVHTGFSHQGIINSVPPNDETGLYGRLSNEWYYETDNAGFVDKEGNFITRDEANDRWRILTMEDARDFIRDRGRFRQGSEQTPQGSIAFTESDTIIRLFESANLSTFQHEMAHFWLEQLKADALATVDTDGNPAARQTFADWEQIVAWFKSEGHELTENGDIPKGAHELFARSWERYLMEGKAPSSRLRKAFRQFQSWLISIYRSVTNLNAPITPEIREVFDRMLATDEELEAARDEQNVRLLFDSAMKAEMSEAAFNDYASLADEARVKANDELLRKTMGTIRKRVTKEYRAAEKAVRDEAAEFVDNQSPMRALNLLRSPGGPRLDKQLLQEMYGVDIVSALPAGLPVFKKNGENPDTIAERVGFRTGDELIDALTGLEVQRQELKRSGDKRSVRKFYIDSEVQRVMGERFGDPLGDGTIEREAIAAIQNDKQGELLATELRQLGSMSRQRATPYQVAKRWAREKIDNGIVNEVASGAAQHRYTQAAGKAGRAAEKAYLAGDTDEAFRQKQIQMLQTALARASAEAGDRVDAAVKRLGKLAKQRTIKSLDQDYLERIHGLLEDYEFKRVSQRELSARDNYAAWAARQAEGGHDVVAVERLAQKKNWSRMSVQELKALDDAVKQLRHLGRLKQTLIDNKEKRAFDEVVGEAIQSAAMLPQKAPKPAFGGESWWGWLKGKVASADSALLKMEEVFDWLDSENSNGVFNRVVFRPLADAQDTEQRMLDDYVGRLMTAMREVPKPNVRAWYQKHSVPELIDPNTGEPSVFTGEELLVMAMNVGNRSNIEKLIGGYGWDVQYGSIDNAHVVVMDVLNRELTADDWNYVQQVWDIINELWPQIADLERRVNGVAPDKVEAVPVETSSGTLRGGYFPVVYNPESKVGQRNLDVENQGLFPNSYVRANTRAGSTRERTEFRGPLHLSLGVINRHVAEVIHDITHREAVMNADKFLSSDGVQQAVTGALGPDVARQFRPWLQHIANEWAADREITTGLEQAMKKVRTNATVVGLGFRFSTMLLQLAGYASTAEVVGTKWLAHGFRKMTTEEGWAFAMENSKELPHRMATMDRDIRNNARSMATRQGDIISAGQRFAFHGIGYMDRVVSVPSWLGAYEKATQQGMDHDEAVYAADKVIRQSQGSGAAKDMSRVQRGTGKMGEALKLMTMFYTWVSAFYQRQRRLGRDASQALTDRDIEALPGLMARSWWLFVVVPILPQLLAGRGPEEDEDMATWAMWQMTVQAFSAIPLVRDAAQSIESGFNYSFTPAEGLGTSIKYIANDIENIAEGDETKRATRNFLELVGYATGKVPGQFASTTQFFVDVAYDEQNPEDLADWLEGISKGKIKE